MTQVHEFCFLKIVIYLHQLSKRCCHQDHTQDPAPLDLPEGLNSLQIPGKNTNIWSSALKGVKFLVLEGLFHLKEPYRCSFLSSHYACSLLKRKRKENPWWAGHIEKGRLLHLMEVYRRNPPNNLCYDKWLFHWINILQPEQKLFGEPRGLVCVWIGGGGVGQKWEREAWYKSESSDFQGSVYNLQVNIKYLCSCHSPRRNWLFLQIKSARILDILWAFSMKQLFNSRLLDMRWL